MGTGEDDFTEIVTVLESAWYLGFFKVNRPHVRSDDVLARLADGLTQIHRQGLENLGHHIVEKLVERQTVHWVGELVDQRGAVGLAVGIHDGLMPGGATRSRVPRLLYPCVGGCCTTFGEDSGHLAHELDSEHDHRVGLSPVQPMPGGDHPGSATRLRHIGDHICVLLPKTRAELHPHPLGNGAICPRPPHV